ncbi:unnamed protein product [Sphenostylis stenocarpa]|uniref:TIR domain-containing protein n=1 Tax=Sphenostylis stenocarpa TaxID=92480 RepID=A0AA86T345_9FABA|nr:unnamed protein product [Sphenostylis stenocarpa]
MSFSDGDDEMEMEFLRDQYHDNRNFEVFLSFRGEDTRASFTSYLYAALQNEGIFVFKDDESLPRGSQISPSLRIAIEASRISIVVFSKNYAESRWCLKELEKIMECHRTMGHVVLPVFYDVDPSEVRHLRGDFGKAFQNLLDKIAKEEEGKVMDWIQRWTKTLGEAADISALEVLYSGKVENWKAALDEVARIPGVVDVNSSWKMEIADRINNLVENWTMVTPVKFGFYMDIDVKIDFGEQWRKMLCEAVSILEVAGLDPCGEMDIINDIDHRLKSWREALFEANGISGGAILNSW